MRWCTQIPFTKTKSSSLSSSPAAEALTSSHTYLCFRDVRTYEREVVCSVLLGLRADSFGFRSLLPRSWYPLFESCRTASNQSSSYFISLLLFSFKSDVLCGTHLLSVENIAGRTLDTCTLLGIMITQQTMRCEFSHFASVPSKEGPHWSHCVAGLCHKLVLKMTLPIQRYPFWTQMTCRNAVWVMPCPSAESSFLMVPVPRGT